ncbi:MAG: hypothetical protein K2N20_07795 [Helicobacter sp.]|nr:hypothetical protein [Helicobacter sp.]
MQRLAILQALQLAIIAILVSLVGYVFTHYKSMELWLIIISSFTICAFAIIAIILSALILKNIKELEDL